MGVEKTIKIIAEKNQLYVLPDSTKVWMQPGSSIRYVQSPNQKFPDRKTKCVIKTHINIKQNVIFGAKLKPV